MAVRQIENGKPGGGLVVVSPLALGAAVLGGLGALVFLLEAARGVATALSGPATEVNIRLAIIVAPMLLGAIVAAAGSWLVASRRRLGGFILLAEGILGVAITLYAVFYLAWGTPLVLVAGILAVIANRHSGHTPA